MVVAVLVGLIVLFRKGRPGWFVAGVVLGNAYLWFVTNAPLHRLYALGPSRDRLNNVGLAQVVAVGGRPLETTQIYQVHFEPFWGWLLAALSFGQPERLLAAYAYLSLVIVAAFSVSLYVALRPSGDGPGGLQRWERAMMAGFATLLCAAPMDFAEPLRNPWAMTFLLKPNHALGLVILPWFVWSFARIRGTRGRIVAGLLLHLVAWAFVLHMIYAVAGLCVFAALSLARRQPDRRRDFIDVVSVIGINLLIVSPYLWMLLRHYPAFVPSTHATIATAHLLEPFTFVAVLFALAAWGARLALRKAGRTPRLLACLWIGAWLIWVGYLALDALHIARERDDLYYYLRILTALLAGLGAWDLMGRVVERWRGTSWADGRRAAVLALIAFPYSMPYWWNPSRMDPYFESCLLPLPARLTEPAAYLRQHAPRHGVVAGDAAVARYVAALAGRRGLLVLGMNQPRDTGERLRLEKWLMEGASHPGVVDVARHYRISHLVVTPAMLERYPGASLARLDRAPRLRRVFRTPPEEADFVALYELSVSP